MSTTPDTTLRVRIAEAQGWKITTSEHFKHLCRPGETKGVCCGIHLTDEEAFKAFFDLGECGPLYVIPDYPNDLNACAQFEAGLTDEQLPAYERELSARVCKLHNRPGPGYKMWNASAAIRCLAYLATINPQEGK